MTKNLVFTSAGDNTQLETLWHSLETKMNYDIVIYYYGDSEEKFNIYKNISKYIFRNKGSKFQNFYHFYLNNQEVYNNYEYFFILDDDIIFENNIDDINKMFYYMKKYKLDISGPSFTKDGLVKWPITLNKENLILQYVNFIEVNVPLFNKKSLNILMDIYDSKLIGWGIDYLYSWLIINNKKNNLAIIHDIKCINPTVEDKCIEERELCKIKNYELREQYWEEFKIEIRFPQEFNKIIYDSINKPISPYPFLYINLPRSKDRNICMIKEFNRVNITNYKKITGYDGYNENIEESFIYNNESLTKYGKSIKYKYNENIFILNKGEMAYYKSQITALEYFINNFQSEYCFICDDDLSFDILEHLDSKFSKYIKLFTDKLENTETEIINLCPYYNKKYLNQNIQKIDFFKYENNNKYWGTACYFISKDTAKNVISNLKKLMNNNKLDFTKLNIPFDDYIYNNFNSSAYPLFYGNNFDSLILNSNENHIVNKNYILKLWNYQIKNLNEISIYNFLEKYKNKHIIFIINKGNAGNYITTKSIINIFNMLDIKWSLGKENELYKNKTLFFGGGANLYKNYKACKSFVLNNINDNNIVILPHTIYSIPGLFETISNNSNIIFLCRELTSYKYVNDNFFIKKNIYLSKDLGLYLNIPKHFLNDNGKEILYCFREDCERTFIPKKNIDISVKHNLKRQNNVDSKKIDNLFYNILNVLSTYKIIHTNRLQIAILGHLLNKKVYLYPNNYFKNEAIYDYSLSNFKNISYVNNKKKICDIK